MIITLLFCVDVKWQISQQPSLFSKLFLCDWQITPLSFENTLLWWLRHSRSNSISWFQGIFLHNPFARSWCLHLLGNFLVACICAWHHFLGVRLYSNYNNGLKILKEYCAWFCQAVWLNLFLLLYCNVNLISESASQGEGCCIMVRDQYLSWGSTAALNYFLTQKSVFRMTRGRSRKRHQSSRKSTDEFVHSQTGQGEEIATSPAQHTSPRRGRSEDFTEMNPSNTGHGRQNPSVNSKKETRFRGRG